ncbi:MAG TPA: MerR family transcriptional regulator [Phenylobacterium sp.]|uniref:MerR family transcriptional regulator n=1 Tax=Phenylobacterium sp. TaxID=1871053 RepID=UPI002D05BCA2|nr:MerR family transcriptional regulator [Phenylobacterium sp.]HSV04318.1 MerR family transcriptional regulator [Phenylobacterium sp.]
MKARRRTIGRLAAEAGVHVETVRFYERRGFIARPPADPGGRSYGDEAVWRIRYIKTAQAWGWKLADIEGLLGEAEQSPNFCAAVRAMARRRIIEIEAQVEALALQRAELTAFIEACAAKPDAERCPVFKRVSGIG